MAPDVIAARISVSVISVTPDPCVLVIFGASGDLATKKLFPALYSLAFRRLLPEHFAVLGVARTEETDDEFRERMKQAVKDHGREPRLLPGHSAHSLPGRGRGARQASLDLGLDAPDRREAVRARPRLGAPADQGDPRALRGARGLPHRPLPGQGNGPEHARAAILERHLRAD